LTVKQTKRRIKMALVEKIHVVVAERPVATGQTIKEGQVVSLNALAQVVIESATYPIPYGIAGDTKSTTASAMPGIAAGWQNRPSDYFDETKASGKMTVYHSGGEFATDQFHANVAAAVALLVPLYARSGVLDTAGEDATPTTYPVARLTQMDGAYPSGVPGTDINGDMALAGDNTNTYIEFKLTI
jgi:hypothetical protein